MNLNSLLCSERRMPATMSLVFLPWIIVVLVSAGAWAAINFFAYAMIVFATGYSIASVALPRPIRTRAEALFLVPAVGIVVISALTAFWLRLGFPLLWSLVLWLGPMMAGATSLWRDRNLWRNSTVAYGGALVVLSGLICAVYFLPGALNDAVLRRDGSFNWIYVDTQFFHAIASIIKNGGSPPKGPGTETAELLYHFGPYAPAALISRLDGLSLGDSFARVTRGASLWALMLSCFGVSTLLSLRATGQKFGGILALAGFFFYGSLMALFTDEWNSSSYVTGAILFKIPDVAVLADGGPFSHLILGHSMLHGLGAITAIMGLCLMYKEQQGGLPVWRLLPLLAFPALAIAVNSVAALYCVGIVGILLFWERLGSARSWLLIVLMLCLFLGAWNVMGYGHAKEAAQATLKQHVVSQWWTLVVGFLAGLGIRIIGFRWISRPLKDSFPALVLASVVGLLAFSLLIRLGDSNERYGIYYLQCMFSLFAFSRFKSGWLHGAERSEWVAEWLRAARVGMAILVACGLLIGIVSYVTHNHPWIPSFPLKVFLSSLFLLFLVGASLLMKRSHRFSTFTSAFLSGVLFIGFLGWITPWLNFGLGRMRMDVTITPGEVQGLRRLDELAAPRDRFATNRHTVDSLASRRERSYAYTALSQRPVLLEGNLDHSVKELPWFPALLRDNDMLFSTTDEKMIRQIAQTWQVRWLVARPGTDIALPRPLPAWLVQQSNCGDLKIYRID